MRVKLEHVFPVPVQVLWDLIGDFGDTGRWSGSPPEACVQEGEGIGALRTLTMADGRRIIDRLEAQGPYFYSYSIVSSPLPVSAYRATMAAAPIDAATSQLTWSSELEPVGMTEADAVTYWTRIYTMGVGLMEASLARSAV